MDWPETRDNGRRRAAVRAMTDLAVYPATGRVRRGKLRRPDLPATVLPRPRLMARIDAGHCPLTLIVAPAGFGKTTVATEWAWESPPAAWVTADSDDASLPRFWAHLHAALTEVVPGVGELVTEALGVPYRATATDLGRMLADELLDAAEPVRLVIDDAHLIPESETHAFLGGLLEIASPGFRLMITSRSTLPLPLARLRLRGVVNELRGADLLFTEEETFQLLERVRRDGAPPVQAPDATDLWQRTRGWAAELRLATVAAQDDGHSAGSESIRQPRLLASLFDEVLAGRTSLERSALLRAALPEAFSLPLLAALLDAETPDIVAREIIDFALAADLGRTSPRFAGEWYESHPLFREELRQRAEREELPDRLAALHRRAAAWFEADGLPDGAIAHWLAAGETLAAIALVEREIQPAFDREDWPAVRRWLSLLPDETIRERTPLLLAKGWLAHLRGQAGQLKSTRHALEEQLDLDVLPPAERAAVRAELDVMLLGTTLPMQIDPEGALATAQAAIANLLPERRFQYGVAWACYGMALQAAGQGHEALARLAWWAEEERVDAASSRGLFGLLFVHWQAGNLSRILSLARTTHEIGSRHRLRLIAGWGHRFLGDALYERNDLAGAIEQYTAVAREYEYFHLTGLREVFFGLAQAYLASGHPAEAWSSLRRVREIMLDADARGHLPALDAEEAYLALQAGDLSRALEWALAQTAGVDSATLYVVVHPVFIRGAILCAAGSSENLAEAMAILTDLRQRAARAHYIGPLVRIDALLAVAHLKRGEFESGLAAMRRSLATGLPQGYCRTYLDLLPVFGDELRLLATEVEYPLPVRAALETQPIVTDLPPLPPNTLDDLLTERERDVLAALTQRLTYKEVAERLYISPLTVKRHASSIYSKLGVAGRTEAIRLAGERGVTP